MQKASPGWLAAVSGLAGDASRSDEFLSAVFSAERPCLSGHGDFPQALAQVLCDWHSPVSPDEALKLWLMIEPDRDVLAIIECLRAGGTRVALATNQQAQRARFMSDDLQYAHVFDDLFYSCHLGAMKPSAPFFAAVLARLGLPGEQVLFIDDHAGNVAAAQEAGLKAEVYDLRSGPAVLRDLLTRYPLAVS